MASSQVKLPPGFVLDGPKTGLPEGFVLDGSETPQEDLGPIPQSPLMVNPSGPVGDAAMGFVSRLARNLNPVTLAKGIGQAVSSPIETSKDLLDAQSRGFINAWDLAGEGRTTEAFGQALSGAVPLFGPAAREIGERAAETGELSTAVGEGLADAVTPRALVGIAKGIPAVAKAAPGVIRPIAVNVKTGLANLKQGVSKSGPAAAGVGTLMTTADPATAYAVYKGAQELAERVGKQVPKADDAVKAAEKAEKAAKMEAFRKKFNETNWKPVRTPEYKAKLQAKTNSEKLSEAQAKLKKPEPKPEVKGDVVEAKPAFPGQQGAKGATKARFNDVAERNAKMMLKTSPPDKVVKLLVNSFKMDEAAAKALVERLK